MFCQVLSQAFNQNRIVNPFAANKGEITPVGRECEILNLFAAQTYADTFLPVWSLWATGVVIPFVELIAGGLVILGLRTREALVSLGFVLAIVTFSHLLKEPLYEFHTHVIPRLALLLFILLLPREDDRFSVDYLRSRKKMPTRDNPRSSQ